MNKFAITHPALQDQVTSKMWLAIAFVVDPARHQGHDADRCASSHPIRENGMLKVHLVAGYKINDVDTHVRGQVLRPAKNDRIARTTKCAFPVCSIQIEHKSRVKQYRTSERVDVALKNLWMLRPWCL